MKDRPLLHETADPHVWKQATDEETGEPATVQPVPLPEIEEKEVPVEVLAGVATEPAPAAKYSARVDNRRKHVRTKSEVSKHACELIPLGTNIVACEDFPGRAAIQEAERHTLRKRTSKWLRLLTRHAVDFCARANCPRCGYETRETLPLRVCYRQVLKRTLRTILERLLQGSSDAE